MSQALPLDEECQTSDGWWETDLVFTSEPPHRLSSSKWSAINIAQSFQNLVVYFLKMFTFMNSLHILESNPLMNRWERFLLVYVLDVNLLYWFLWGFVASPTGGNFMPAFIALLKAIAGEGNRPWEELFFFLNANFVKLCSKYLYLCLET